MISKDFLKKYHMIDEVEKDFLVNRFWTIGMGDPYPDDDLHILGSRDDVRDLGLPTKADH